MATEKITFDDLIAIDKTYLERIRLRRKVMDENPTEAVAHLPGSEAMINELYSWLFSIYLPRRFPSMFLLIAPMKDASDAKTRDLFLRNRVTNESIPITPPADPNKALYTISANIDNDFLLLYPRPVQDASNSSDTVEAEGKEEKYHLLAFATLAPSGWRPMDKLGRPLNKIHEPVPGYEVKLEKSMDRFFASMPVGKIVRRSNWTITTDDEIFNLKGNHFHDLHEGGNEEALKAEIERQKALVNVEECRLRTERQTLHRLPETKGLVFGFKTYLYPLSEVKGEENGEMAERLAEAIEGFGKGSVPEMTIYKRQVVWGDKVLEYLRS